MLRQESKRVYIVCHRPWFSVLCKDLRDQGSPPARTSVLRLRTGVLGSSPPRRFLISELSYAVAQ